MYTEELFQTQRRWAEEALLLLRDLLPLMSPFGQNEAWNVSERRTMGYLLSAAARSSESVLLLVAYGQLWDSEPLIRSVFEATLKFSYLCQSADTFKDRHQEYSVDHVQCAHLKDHQKVSDLLRALPNAEDSTWRPFRDRVLGDEVVADLRQRYPSGTRRALEARWGFTGIINSLTRSNDPLFANFDGLAHGYSLSSHVQHADYLGVSMPLDRDLREGERRDLAHLTHAIRLISDVFTCFQLRLAVAYRFVGADEAALREAFEIMNRCKLNFGDTYDRWLSGEYGQPSPSSATAP